MGIVAMPRDMVFHHNTSEPLKEIDTRGEWNYIKLLFEAAERYILLGVLVFTAPVSFSDERLVPQTLYLYGRRVPFQSLVGVKESI